MKKIFDIFSKKYSKKSGEKIKIIADNREKNSLVISELISLGIDIELKHLKIAVMGCIVNGPGEMADADYGYVGSGKGKVSLYRHKEIVMKNIREKDAVKELVLLIKANGDWID